MSDVSEAVEDFLDSIEHQKRRRDARTLFEVMSRVTGEQAQLWGTIVGFGQYHYRYESGRQGDAPAASFSPRRAASTIYLPDGVGAHTDLLERLGPHTTGVGCVYIKDVAAVDLGVLEELV
ncbi:MAG: DUF1801 domain-containing protein, partial [Acidimicrobiia bacterium]